MNRNYMTVRLKREVSLVILPIDDFTENVIKSPSFRMYTEDGSRQSIRKMEGYHVFCDLEGSCARICMEDPLYQKQVLEFPLGNGIQVFQIRMLPNAAYPLPAGATCIKGKIRPYGRIRLFFPEQKKNYKLLYDYEPKTKNKEISIFLPEILHLEGKTLCIKNGEIREFFRITDQKNEVCQMEHPLKNSYKKVGTSIYPVYEVTADREGRFYLPIRNIPTENCMCLIKGKEQEPEICRILQLFPEKENKITEEIYEEEKKG